MTTVNQLPPPPLKLAVGAAHSFVIGGKSEKIYAFGKNQNNMFQDDKQLFNRITELQNLKFGINTKVKEILQAKQEDSSSSSGVLPNRCKIYQIASSGNHALALVKNSPEAYGGYVIGWGFGIRGRLAQPDPALGGEGAEIEDPWNAPYPLHVSIPRLVLRITAGADFSFALTINNEVYAWGCNSDGQLGFGHQDDVKTARKIPEFGLDNPAIDFAAGARHGMILSAERMLYVAGATANGRLGTGSRVMQAQTNVTSWSLCATLNTVCSQIACGEAHSAGIDAERGTLYTWGAASFGRLGHGDCLDGPLPSVVRAFDESAKQVALGAFHTVVLTTKGRLWAWGTGSPLGYMNDGDNAIVAIPRRINFEFLGPVLQIAAGPFHTVALCSNGRVACWGNGSHGRVGQGQSTKNVPKPKFLSEFDQSAISSDENFFSDALRANEFFDNGEKKLRAIAGGKSGPSGADDEDDGPKDKKSAYKVKTVQCGAMHSGALTEGGALYVWGAGESGQTGQRGSTADLWLPKRLEFSSPVTKIAFGYEHCLCITSNMELYAWGRGGQGQLGINQAKSTDNPVLVHLPTGVLAKECSAGETHSGAVSLDGQAFTWGDAQNGCLGLGKGVISGQQPGPRKLEENGFNKIRASKITCGLQHTGIVSEDGQLFMFGAGWFGRLGLNTMNNVYAPTLVPLPRKVSQLALAAYHTLVVDEKNDLYVWGRDRCVCEPMDCTMPKKFTQLGESVKIKTVACREAHSLAVTQEGEVYVWGENNSHQLGLPKSMMRLQIQMPEQLNSLPGTVVQLATGPSHSLGIMSNGEVYAWGDQSCGRLGLSAIQEPRFVDVPTKVEPVWSSIEAMTAGSQGRKSQGEEEDDSPAAEDDDKDNAADEAGKEGEGDAKDQGPSEKDQLFNAMREGAGIKEMSTIQSLIKQEPPSAKEIALGQTEASLKKDYEIFLKDILVNVAGFERRKMEKFTDVDGSFKTTTKFLSNVKPPDTSNKSTGKKKTNPNMKKITALLPRFEELVWSLQQQPAYLAELSMHIGDLEKEKIFYRFVGALYKELDDERTKHLFMATLKVMIKHEVEECKEPSQVFQPDRSRVFHLFSQWALQPYFREEVVHSIMDLSRKSGLMCTLDRGVKELSHHFYLTKDEFMQANANTGGEKDAQELTVEFNANLERFREYVQGEFLNWLSNLDLPMDIQKIMFHALQTIKARRFTVTQDDITIGLDLQLCEPLARLFVLGILLPQFENFAFYSGKIQGLGNPAQLAVAADGSIKNNVKKISIFLKKLVMKTFVEATEKQLSIISRQVKPALLQFCKEQSTKLTDDTDTQVTIDVFTSHYDCQEHLVQLRTSDLLNVTSLLLEHESKIGLTEEDYLVMELIPPFADVVTEEVIKSITAKPDTDVIYNFKMNARFLLTSPSMVFCKTSKAPVPRRLSAETSSGGEEDSIEVVKAYSMPEDPNDPRAVLQDLWNALPALESTNFKDMKLEFEMLKKQYANMTPPDYVLTKKIDTGIGKLDELILADTQTVDVFAYIVEQLLMRDRHRIYLENVDSGRREIREARATYYEKSERVLVELALMKKFCTDPKLPKVLTDTAYEVAGARWNMNTVAQKIATLRTVEPDDIPEGASFNPQKTLTLGQLYTQKVVKSITHPDLDPLPEKRKKKELQFTFSFNSIAELEIVVILNAPKTTAMITKLKVPVTVLTDLNKKASAAEGGGGGKESGEGESATL
ncbi:unnamed protein product, partial [Amoebophrya sp. A120]|eukprot:GSA120T00019843001.1